MTPMRTLRPSERPGRGEEGNEMHDDMTDHERAQAELVERYVREELRKLVAWVQTQQPYRDAASVVAHYAAGLTSPTE